MVPKDLVAIFNDHELELIISGLPEVDVADIKANTDYTGPSHFNFDGMAQWQWNAVGYTAASQVIQWFWSVVEEFDAENLALLLQFVTGIALWHCCPLCTRSVLQEHQKFPWKDLSISKEFQVLRSFKFISPMLQKIDCRVLTPASINWTCLSTSHANSSKIDCF